MSSAEEQHHNIAADTIVCDPIQFRQISEDELSLQWYYELDNKFFVLDRVSIAAEVFEHINKHVFNDKLLDVQIQWSSRLQRSAGLTKVKRSTGACTISLSNLVLTDFTKMINQLAHEICHVAVFQLDKIYLGKHDSHFMRYSRKIMQKFHCIEVASTMGCRYT
jgi:predicted SprT family Zn-dependent metalloprotease